MKHFSDLYWVRSIAEADYFLNRLTPPERAQATFAATNEEVRRYLDQRSCPCYFYDVSELREQYIEINRFAYEAVLRILRRPEASADLRIYIDSMFYDLRTTIGHALKHLLMLRILCHEGAPARMHIIESAGSSLLVCLNSFLRQRSPNDIVLKTYPALKARRPSVAPVALLKRLMERISRLRGSGASRALTSQRPSVMFSGGLNHMKEICQRLPEGSVKGACFVDYQYSFEVARVCRSIGIDHYVLPTIASDRLVSVASHAADLTAGCEYEGENLDAYLRTVLKKYADSQRLTKPFDPVYMMRWLRKRNIGQVVLDEDYASRRSVSVCARELNIPCRVMSHGWPMSGLDAIDRPLPDYRTGTMIVNSDFEKEAYQRQGYAAGAVRVSGIPRYDRLHERLRSGSFEVQDPSRVFLFCASSTSINDADRITAGTSQVKGTTNAHWEYQKEYIRLLCRVFRARGRTRLWIKAHYAGEGALRELIDESGAGEHVRLYPHQADIFELEMRAHALITAPSTVILEGLMLKKPVIVLDFADDGAAEPFESRDVVTVVRNEAQLRNALIQCEDDVDWARKRRQKTEQYFEYFCGRFDGRNTDRALELLGVS